MTRRAALLGPGGVLIGALAAAACGPAEAVETRAPAAAPASQRTRTLTVPASTVLDVRLETAVGSETSRVEDPVRASVVTPVYVNDVKVIPRSSLLMGEITHVRESGKVKGRAELTVRFTRLKIGAATYDLNAMPLRWAAKSTRSDDAAKIGLGAAAGAVVGALAGGGKGAAIGSAVGAGGGTAVVLATEGDEIRLGTGRRLRVELAEPLMVSAVR